MDDLSKSGPGKRYNFKVIVYPRLRHPKFDEEAIARFADAIFPMIMETLRDPTFQSECKLTDARDARLKETRKSMNGSARAARTRKLIAKVRSLRQKSGEESDKEWRSSPTPAKVRLSSSPLLRRTRR
jgi:hypothetical protein